MYVTRPIPESKQQKHDVLAVIEELGVSAEAEERMVEALNKIDLLDAAKRAQVAGKTNGDVDQVGVSALTGEGMDELLLRIDRQLSGTRRTLDLQISLSDGATLAWLYRHGDVVTREDVDGVAHVRVGLDAINAARFHHRQQSAENPAHT